MALKDIWKDLQNATEGIAGSGDDVSAEPINMIAHAVIDNEINLVGKVDKISGKGLSTEDYTTAEKEKLSGLANYDDTQIKSDIQTQQDEIDNLDNRISSVEVSIGDIDTALDGIIAIQNKLIGGGTA